MIKYADLKKVFSKLDFPIEEFNLEEDNMEIPIPSGVYISGKEMPVFADGSNYFSLMEVQLELLTEKVDFEKRKKVEEILAHNDVSFTVETEYSNEHRIYSTIYSFEVIV